MKAGGLQRARMLGVAAGAALMLSAGAAFAKAPMSKDAKPKPAITHFSSREPAAERIQTVEDSVRAAAVPMTVENFNKITGNARVVFFGESHGVPRHRNLLADSARFFKEAGFTHISLELADSTLQPSLDNYFKTGMMDRRLSQYLAIADLTHHGHDVKLSLLYLFKQCRQNGIRILPGSEPPDIMDRLRQCYRDVYAPTDSSKDLYLQKKDSIMAKVVLRALQSESDVGRIMVLGGSFHSNVCQNLRKEGIGASAIRLTVPNEILEETDTARAGHYDISLEEKDARWYRHYAPALEARAGFNAILLPLITPSERGTDYDAVLFINHGMGPGYHDYARLLGEDPSDYMVRCWRINRQEDSKSY